MWWVGYIYNPSYRKHRRNGRIESEVGLDKKYETLSEK
jgi:hypothetical protein